MNYSYNGVKLPALPEWDKESYPYAVIMFHSPNQYSFVITSTAVVVSASGYTLKHPSGNLTPFYIGNTELISLGERNWGEFDFVSTSLYSGKAFWANFDILDEDGSLYLAASDPVPVKPPNPSAMAMGMLVGQAVRRMRGK